MRLEPDGFPFDGAVTEAFIIGNHHHAGETAVDLAPIF
jgi:hypothetical protein